MVLLVTLRVVLSPLNRPPPWALPPGPPRPPVSWLFDAELSVNVNDRAALELLLKKTPPPSATPARPPLPPGPPPCAPAPPPPAVPTLLSMWLLLIWAPLVPVVAAAA